MKLYHLSEEASIKKFIPRASKEIWQGKKYVWALSEDKAHNYFFPRDCPRICVGQEVIRKENFFDSTLTKRKAVVFISEEWEERFKTCVLYRYRFDPKNFNIIDAIAGYFVSEFEEDPIQVQTIEDCPLALRSQEVEVMIKSIKELKEIRDELLNATNQFSIIKWDNLFTLKK